MQKIVNSTSAVIALLLLLVMFGCNKGGMAAAGGGIDEKQLVGNWKGKVTLPPDKAKDPGAQMALSLLKDLSLEMKADKTFTMKVMFPMEGTWSLAGNDVSLKITKAGGQDINTLKQKSPQSAAQMDKPMVLVVSPDLKTMTAQAAPGQQAQGSMVFTKG